MFETGTPIFDALRTAQTPIFHALTVGRARLDGHRVRSVAEPPVDPVARFHRDPLTAPIPVQVYDETWRRAEPPRPVRRSGRHRLLASA